MMPGPMLDQMAQAIALIACAVTFWRAESALNSISRATQLRVHTACWLLVVGAIAVASWVLAGAVPDWTVLILLVGIALRLLCERRSCPRGDPAGNCR